MRHLVGHAESKNDMTGIERRTRARTAGRGKDTGRVEIQDQRLALQIHDRNVDVVGKPPLAVAIQSGLLDRLEDPVNQYRTDREPASSFLKWYD